MAASPRFKVTSLAWETDFANGTDAFTPTEGFVATDDLIASEDLIASDDFMATDAFVATKAFLATKNRTFAVSERFIPTALFPRSRLLDRSAFPTTAMPGTSQENNSGGGKVLSGSWVMIIAIAGAAVALMVAAVVAWQIAKCVRGNDDSDLPPESSEAPMESEAGTGFGSFTHDLSAIYYENPNELEGMDMVDSEPIATDLMESDGVLLDDPNELL